MISELIDREILATVSPRKRLNDQLLKRLSDYERDQTGALRDEQLWTLLCTYGYAVCGKAGIDRLARVLTQGRENLVTTAAWMEMLPSPARQGISGTSESNSEIDLILGDIGQRCGRGGAPFVSGVQYAPAVGRCGWVCLVEAKFLEDIATKTTHDPCRNQMARVIETALTFQCVTATGIALPDHVHFTLLTPEVFQATNSAEGGSRLYSYKFREYGLSRHALRQDIDAAIIPPRNDIRWSYPDLDGRVNNLAMHWVTFEALIRDMPREAAIDPALMPFRDALIEFIRRQPNCLLRVAEVA